MHLIGNCFRPKSNMYMPTRSSQPTLVCLGLSPQHMSGSITRIHSDCQKLCPTAAWRSTVSRPRQHRSGRGSLAVKMVRTESKNQIPLGTQAPSFKLPEPLIERDVSLAEFKSPGTKAVVVCFICNHCPFVQPCAKVLCAADGILQLAEDIKPQGVPLIAISSNSVKTHPQDGPDKMADLARSKRFGFPYLFDESQEVAKAWGAVCTPEFFVLDSAHKLVWHGQFDDSRPSNDKAVTGADIRAAIEAVLSGQKPPAGKPSIGCSIKWHPEH